MLFLLQGLSFKDGGGLLLKILRVFDDFFYICEITGSGVKTTLYTHVLLQDLGFEDGGGLFLKIHKFFLKIYIYFLNNRVWSKDYAI